MNNLEPQQPQAQPQPAQKSASPPPSAPPGQPTQPPAPSSSSLSSMPSSSLSQQAAQPAAAQSPSPVYHFKVLVPAAAAGRIIGKGGNAIVQLQKDAGARIKLSKASEFYPGTTERVCLISGPIEGILKIIESIVKSLTPDHLSRPNISSSPPNSSNNNISHTNSTTNTNNNNNHNNNNSNNNVSNSVSTYGQMLSSSSTATSSTAVATALHLSRPANSLSPPGCNPNTSLTPVGRSISPAPSVTSDMNSAQIIETIKLVLRVSGYGEDAVSEISSGMSTLASYGVLGVGLGLL